MEDRWITDWEPSKRFTLYTRANSGEVLPGPCSPLGWDLVFEKGVAPGWEDGVIRWGCFTKDETDEERPEYIACFGGYFYLNAAMLRIVGVRTPGLSPETTDAAFLGDHPDIPPYVAQEGDERPELTAKIEETMGWIMTATSEPEELTEDREKILSVIASRPDLGAASNEELVARARSMSPLIREFFEPYYIYGTAASVGPGILAELLAEVDPSLPGRLITGLGGIDSAPPSHELWSLSRTVSSSETLTNAFEGGMESLRERLEASDEGNAFLSALGDFISKHGARGPGEWDARSATWEIDPDVTFAAVDAMRHADESLSPDNRHLAAVQIRENAEREARDALAGSDEALSTLEMALRVCKIFIPTRERTKLTEMLAVHEIRLPMYELGNRMAKSGILQKPQDVFLLLDSEIDAFIADPEGMKDIITARSEDYEELKKLQDPFIIIGDVPPLSEWEQRDSSAEPVAEGEELTGIPGSPGTVTGKARVITDPSDPRGLEPGEILVAPITDPSWTPLFVPAAAVVVEVGAPLSHAVIVSREFGVPCVTAVHQAASRISNGTIITVNGDTGSVTVLETP
ncbi:MAG TPA: phosphoenolpyruvate-utilizing protein [Acidimicrobiaceae bacterium]|jgi:phosphoenolpyruvate synthase/pyruvate phosphate dikinase|nr:phosphoenolpyruvate-utilizing protein [Acidimicrobiaceae bacterium]|tara:strand:- start:3115 stop:4842 length:1728 start_codon:yes stop_codon:yes gene_type:complete